MNSRAWLIVHMKLVNCGDMAVPSHVGIYSESADTLTRDGSRECLAVIMSDNGNNYGEAKEAILKRIATDIRIRGLDSEYRWIVPLMNDRDAEAINDILEGLDADDGRYGSFELENAGSQPKPR